MGSDQEQTPQMLESRLATARLRHTVEQLQVQVDNDRLKQAPARKMYHCVIDESALIAHISGVKSWTQQGKATIFVPFGALDVLDRTKKGSCDVNIAAREVIRYLDRGTALHPQQKPVKGVKVQSPDDRYSAWAECVAVRLAENPLPTLPSGDNDPETEPPVKIQSLLNCALHYYHRKDHTPVGDDDEVIFVTTDPDATKWARHYGLPTYSPSEVDNKIQHEDIEFKDRIRHYEFEQKKTKTPNVVRTRAPRQNSNTLYEPDSPTENRHRRKPSPDQFSGNRTSKYSPELDYKQIWEPASPSGRGGKPESVLVNGHSTREPKSPTFASRGGRGGGRGGGRKFSPPEIYYGSPRGETRRPTHQRASSPDYVVRGPTRGVARGRGKLWEP